MSYCRSYRAAYYNIKKKIPTVIEIHTPKLNNFEVRLLLGLSNDKYFKGLVTISNILKANFVKMGVSEKKLIVLEDSVDLNKFNKITKSKNELRSELNLPLNKKVVMYCGSLKAGKGIGIIQQVKLEVMI